MLLQREEKGYCGCASFSSTLGIRVKRNRFSSLETHKNFETSRLNVLLVCQLNFANRVGLGENLPVFDVNLVQKLVNNVSPSLDSRVHFLHYFFTVFCNHARFFFEFQIQF